MRKTHKLVAKDTKDDFLTKVGMLMEDDPWFAVKFVNGLKEYNHY